MRRSSEEELCLLRAHDMEEGSSHSEFSSSGEPRTEEVGCTVGYLSPCPTPPGVSGRDAESFLVVVVTV